MLCCEPECIRIHGTGTWESSLVSLIINGYLLPFAITNNNTQALLFALQEGMLIIYNVYLQETRCSGKNKDTTVIVDGKETTRKKGDEIVHKNKNKKKSTRNEY